MSPARAPVPERVLADDAVRASLLLGAGAEEPIRAALEPSGAELMASRPQQVIYVPRRRLTVAYATSLRTRADDHVERMVVLRTGHEPKPGTTVLGRGDDRLEAWVVPDDPELPGFALAAGLEVARELASGVGLDSDLTETRIHSYRPGRRAVVEWRAGPERVFVKCLRPSRIAELQDLHETLGDPFVVARSLGWSAELGLMVVEAIPGSTLGQALHGDGPLPDGNRLLEILDRLPPLARTGKGLDRDVDHHRRLLTALLPEREEQVEMLATRLRAPVEAGETTLHGDFHPGQLLVDGAQVLGVIDVDRARRGQRVDDLAVMLAHLHSMASRSRGTGRHAAYGRALLSRFDEAVDPAALRLRVATSLFGLAAGGFGSQQPDWQAIATDRLEAATAWVDAADRTA